MQPQRVPTRLQATTKTTAAPPQYRVHYMLRGPVRGLHSHAALGARHASRRDPDLGVLLVKGVVSRDCRAVCPRAVLGWDPEPHGKAVFAILAGKAGS